MSEEFKKETVFESTLDSKTQVQLGRIIAPKESSGKAWWVAISLCLLVAVSVLVWFFFKGGEKGEPKIDLDIQAVEQLPSSGEVAMQVGVTSQDSRALRGVNLELVYPSGFSFISSIPQSQEISGKNFILPNLSSGQNATALVRVRVQANVGDEKQLKAILRYKLAGESAVFVKEVVKVWKVVSSGVVLKIEGPAEVGNGELVALDVNYSNDSTVVLENVKIVLDQPKDFKVGQATPVVNGTAGSWIFPRLDPGQKGKISLVGSFTGATLDGQENFKVMLSVLDKTGSYSVQADSSFVISIRNQALSVSQSLSNSGQSMVAAGGRVNYTIKYKNNSAFPIKNAKIIMKVAGGAVDWGESKAEGAKIGQGNIVWSPATTDELSVVSPSGGGVFQVELKINDPAVKDSTKDLNILSSLSIASDEFTTPLSGEDLEVKIKTRPMLLVNVKYLSGAEPPRVGQETYYQVTLGLKNTSSDIGNGSVTIRLPFGAGSLVKGSFAKDVTVENSRSRLTWNTPILQAYSGVFSPTLTTTFQLRVVPTAAQVGESLTLLADLNFTGQDTYTGQPVTASSLDITSDKASGSGKGRVVK